MLYNHYQVFLWVIAMISDLNLLPSLQVLLAEKNISRAAEIVGITQSAMSRSFARLKKELQDPLMVRVNNQYTLTDTAVRLKAELEQIMPKLNQFGEMKSLDLKSENREIHIAGTDLDILTVRQGIKKIQQEAPNLRLSIRNNSPRMIDDLLSAEIDFLFTAMDDERAGLYRRLVASDSFVAVVAHNSPLAESNFDLDAYLTHKHGMFAFAEKTRVKVDEALSLQGQQRKIALSLPSFSQIPPFLNDNQLIFSLPQGFANYLAKHYPIRILPLPFEVEPLNIYLYWHQRNQSNELHRWIKNCLLNMEC